MNRSSMLYALLLLMVLGCATSSFAIITKEHLCLFDEFNGDAPPLLLVQELPGPRGASQTTFSATSTGNWRPIRIHVSTADLYNSKKYCTSEDNLVLNPIKDRVICTEHDILTDEKRHTIKRIVHSAIQMHTTRLNVRRIKYGFKVPKLTGNFCSNFTVPEEHHSIGVGKVDMVLYVAPWTARELSTIAISAPCAALQDGRPVVGGIAFSVSDAIATPHTVRVAAHEIAHALGFSFKLFDSNKVLSLQQKKDVRKKDHVLEVAGSNTLRETQKHFGCSRTTGMELEDEKGDLEVPSHSHWERRNALDELMAPIVSNGYYSALTLALFTDLGYYQGRMEMAESMEWGASAGCDFLEAPCITNGKTNYPNMFCTDSSRANSYCTADNKAIGSCSFISTKSVDVPTPYQYFSDKTKSGDESPMTDRCPIVHYVHATYCQAGDSIIHGVRGPNSMCLRTEEGSIGLGPDGDSETMCAIVQKKENGTLQLTYDTSNSTATCADGKATLGGTYTGAVIKCPKEAELTLYTQSYDAVLLNDSEEKMNATEVTVYDPSQPVDLSSSDEGKTNADCSITLLLSVPMALFVSTVLTIL